MNFLTTINPPFLLAGLKSFQNQIRVCLDRVTAAAVDKAIGMHCVRRHEAALANQLSNRFGEQGIADSQRLQTPTLPLAIAVVGASVDMHLRDFVPGHYHAMQPNQPGEFRHHPLDIPGGTTPMKNTIKFLAVATTLFVSANATASCGIETSHDIYDGYEQYTFYNSCDGDWSVWTYSDGGYSYENSNGSFHATFVNGF